VLKWGNMFSEPHHFDEEPVTAEAVANHLAKHVCIKMGTVPVAELAMRVFYGSGKGAIDRDGTKLGIDVLLGRRIFYNMLNEIKLHIASSELEDEETVEVSMPISPGTPSTNCDHSVHPVQEGIYSQFCLLCQTDLRPKTQFRVST